MQQWFSAAEIAQIVGVGGHGIPSTERGVRSHAERERWPWRPAEGRKGGGREYPISALPLQARAALAYHIAKSMAALEPSEEAKAIIDSVSSKKLEKAKAKFAALLGIERLMYAGCSKSLAVDLMAAHLGVQRSTIYYWEAATKEPGLAQRADWVAALVPRHTGLNAKVADCSPEAWDMLRSDYLRPERPSLTSCLRRVQAAAAKHGWVLPAERTLRRRIEAIPHENQTLARRGTEALKQSFPAQERRRDHFHALEAVNADGHKWDVAARWPDGHLGRPVMVAFQDLYSGKVLSWRIDRTENRDAVRLAFGDMVETFGIPDHCWLDNGRSFTAGWLTGGIPTRYRKLVRDADVPGLMKQMNIEVHFTNPYSGQSKPIERAFRDFADAIAKDPAFAGAYMGNKPDAKPENYGSHAVPIEEFERIVSAGIAEHNARPGRRSQVANGRSFDDVFADSYARSMIRKPTPEQFRLWLLAAEAVQVSRRDATISLLGNRYFNEALLELRGHRVAVRFDPQALHDGVHVYRPNGSYLGLVPVIEAAGFNDTDAARRHAAERKRREKGIRMQLDAERRMSIDQVAALIPRVEPQQPEPPRLVRLVTGASVATAVQPAEPDFDEQSEHERAIIRGVRRLRVIHNEEEDLL